MDVWHGMFGPTDVDASGTGTYTSEVTVMTNTRIIWTADPINIKAILAGQFADFGKGEVIHEQWKPFVGDGIFGVDGELWHFARSSLRPMFTKERIADLDSFERCIQKLLPLLGNGDGKEVEFLDCMYRFTLDAATDFLLGSPVGSLDSERNKFAKWFGNVQYIQSLITRSG